MILKRTVMFLKEDWKVTNSLNISITKRSFEKINQQKYDLILLDVLMPEVNGLEVLIKSEQYSADKLRGIIVSSFDDVESISKCIQ